MSTTSITRFAFCILCAAFFLVGGCATPKPDPLAGWKVLYSEKLNKAITDDYRDYIQKQLSPKKYFIDENNIWFFENGAGQHAVKIEIPYNGTWLENVLIYDNDNKRIQVIKYSGGNYRS